MINGPAGGRQIFKRLVLIEILDGNHVDGTDQRPIVIVGQERPSWERLRIVEELSQAREEVR
jgi:hypothetical protein